MTRFLEDLKRRSVVRAGLVYAASGFVILQVADLLAAGLRLPGWVFPTVTVLVLLGLPLTLVLSWTFDVTTSGVERTRASAQAAPPAWLGRGTLVAVGALAGLGAVLATGWIATPDRLLGFADEDDDRRAYVIATLASGDVDISHQPDRFAVSPDGRAIAFVGLDGAGRSGLLLRRRGELEPAWIAASARAPTFSPDGRSVAHVESGAGLMKLALPDGQPLRLASMQEMRPRCGFLLQADRRPTRRQHRHRVQSREAHLLEDAGAQRGRGRAPRDRSRRLTERA